MKAVRAAIICSLAWTSILMGCSDPSVTPTPPPPERAAWQVIFNQSMLNRAVLSIWGTSPTDVFAVGGPLGNGLETLAIHYDGQAWKELHPGGMETYWWVGGSGPTDVWMVGEKGRITHWDGKTFQEHSSGTTATLWGVWSASSTDAWIVGGTPEGGTIQPNDIVLHWNGMSWSSVALPNDVIGRAYYKVWGTSSEDLYVVGEYGTIWHKKGAVWELESMPPVAMGTLFTVAGSSSTDIYAVGNFDVLHSNGMGWERLNAPLTGNVNGVATTSTGKGIIVGSGGLKQRFAEGQWIDDFIFDPHGDLHAAWADADGAYWAVGGNFFTPPDVGASREGIVARFGMGKISTELQQ